MQLWLWSAAVNLLCVASKRPWSGRAANLWQVVVVVVRREREREQEREPEFGVSFFSLRLLDGLAHMSNNDTPKELVKFNKYVGNC